MNFLISDAYAQQGQAAGGGFIEFLIMIVIFFAIMYFLIIRPQSKRAKEHKAMVDGLNKGDEIVTQGGLVGKITQVTDNFIKVEVSEGNTVNVQRQSVATVLPKGTMKDI
ncbi:MULTISPECIES: preprotein translocase subunit YajC [Ectothiorhodospira]|uniref:Sec translocon accessory complex subunit YajC n=1 Tax=Ectothiorhodospira haloalkaliphila TaxID=421628 RepID=W8L6T1_9GAMM|nr:MULTISPECIES: preprotein translocase subunit YajC [Ectothiorhodospira]TVQ74501.1 MAG: preprotein translocase subunit YajC [Chromatiaceae bacterium]AHK79570.1 preprotein translocase subunit YidC [Ectothiorhodospira haloalkaliphila]ANB03524.1 preprotein translocase subunit YidC [Ectothiorhodospira sp. BSL-9]MCG5493029.1 preprotein translocase subunit YajC [Ectothiorhodospira variabilis]MCG5497250.1 preprotein translocase subunit YajC [Ectothiorhodospira variabilis]